MKRFVYVLISGFMFMMSLSSLAVNQVFAASGDPLDPTGQACQALGAASGSPGNCDEDSAAGPKIDNTLALGINAFSFIVGVAAVIMIIVGGFKYVTSQGESSNTAGAKNTILYAIIGLVVVALAQIIVKFVLEKAPE